MLITDQITIKKKKPITHSFTHTHTHTRARAEREKKEQAPRRLCEMEVIEGQVEITVCVTLLLRKALP